jgi:hypothetical protein
MSSSASSPARRALEEYLAGRLAADRLVTAVAGRYYGPAGRGERDALRPVIEVVERAAPGVVSLERRDGAGAGFEVKPVERPFPPQYEDALRTAARAALGAAWSDPPASAAAVPEPTPRAAVTGGGGWFARLVGAVRRLFSAST